MRRRYVIGICFLLVGALMLLRGYERAPSRAWWLGTGAIFVVAGIRHLLRARRIVHLNSGDDA